MLLTARYVLPIAAPHIENGAVLVRDDKIVEIGDIEHLRTLHPDEPVQDFGLAALLPGFIDLHTHLEYTALRGLVDDLPYSRWKYQLLQKERLFDAQDWEDSALLGALESLQSGITTVADVTETGASGRAAQVAGLRGIIYREVATMEKPLVAGVMADAEADIEEWRRVSDGGRLTIGIAPHAPYSCHPELFRAVADYAADGTPVSLHLAGSREEYQFVKYGSSMLATDVRDVFDADAPLWLPTGVSPVRYVLQWGILDAPNVVAVHCTQVDDSDIEVLANHNIAVAHCPRCNAKLGMGITPVLKMLEKGIRVGLGTDSPAASNSMDVFEEMRIGLLVQRAVLGEQHFMVARQFVKMATLDAARALGIEDRVGSLEPGKQADIIAVDLSKSHQIPTHHPYSTLVHTANQENVLWTMIDGRVVYDAREWPTLDHERIFARAEQMRMKLRV
ncbi:MAG: amidohydrolase [Actinobacteria bacterium HGW-Actinobacteria-7]|jgi:5-methylthioadenosine/S-adenosylhomocysteine deaminase|nr:MAG: amidohydrolase [Actinobacteria bacterium HGW-Actinobacteria-7]